MLTCPLVKLAHLIGCLAVRLDLHHGFPLGRRMAERGAIRDMQRAGGQPVTLHELRRLVASGLSLKFAPELRFALDETFDRMDETRRLFARDDVRRDLETNEDDDRDDDRQV